MKTNADWEDYKKRHPVNQASHTGLWGYARVYDCLDLSRCYYKTRRAAQLARAREYKVWLASSQKTWNE